MKHVLHMQGCCLAVVKSLYVFVSIALLQPRSVYYLHPSLLVFWIADADS
jgi:hypothetical protein